MTALLDREVHRDPFLRVQGGWWDAAMLPVLPGAPHAIVAAFERMEIAEEEVRRARRLHPDARDRLEAAFPRLVPPDLMVNKAREVYRCHVRELLGRVVDGHDLTPGTDAEVMCVLSLLSLDAPLNATHATLYERIFTKVFPKVKLGGHGPREPWPGACDELLVTLRKRAARVRRVA